MKLNHPGVYRIIGENIEVLADIRGEVPCLSINIAILMNDFVQKGKLTVLDNDSIEIQEILGNPDKFVFIEFDYSEICKLPPHRKSIRGEKMPDITNEQFEEFVQRYIEDTQITKRGVSSTKAYIMHKMDWSVAQAHLIIMQIGKHLSRKNVSGILSD